ncbi:hypothetical protein NBV64_06010 [Alcaligenes sp. DN25]|uniref:hypothetical protein n=1 Tax=Alcaligenes TaxID=507 RepID=UPI00202E6640|nr:MULTISPECIES: hypothetical protein [Alcaligenes]URW83907.1 hypothetical protein NBV64_06010 [Alcaligenes sp. DN25]WEA68745.1 hypothetical protein PWH35_06020 [Alcaligenes faecalis]
MKISTASAILCQNPRFQAYLGVTSAEDAAVHIRTRCRVSSRRELDCNGAAAARFHELRRQFAYGKEVGISKGFLP